MDAPNLKTCPHPLDLAPQSTDERPGLLCYESVMSSQALYQPPELPDPETDAGKVAALETRVTPMMAQYVEIKAANPDCLLFYRMGDFYELFFEDAETASRALGIVLTKRGKHLGNDIPMCGVPIDRADDYLQRLIGLGHRVAVCEQMEDPAEAKKRGAKSVVRRDVVRLVTPGTITEERLLDPGRPNFFLALARRRISETEWRYGLAAVDISTGHFALSETDGPRAAGRDRPLRTARNPAPGQHPG